MTKKYKRKKLNLTVKREFQKWLLIRIMASVFLSSLIAAVILYFYARHEVVSTFYDAHIKIRRVSDLLLPVVAAGSAVSLASGALLAIFLPQKIAGPLFRIEMELEKVKQGDLSGEIKLRRCDVLQDHAKSINETIAILHTNMQNLKDVHAQIMDRVMEEDRNEFKELIEKQGKCLNNFIT
ncbi:MAG: methyl-accepting chemotaxis protein [Desulfobulbaceae bacterium]|nr:methyl-accepting chemotaxis protein [Desulfobulbaceae bacterium]